MINSIYFDLWNSIHDLSVSDQASLKEITHKRYLGNISSNDLVRLQVLALTYLGQKDSYIN